MIRPSTGSTRTDTLFPDTTLFQACRVVATVGDHALHADRFADRRFLIMIVAPQNPPPRSTRHPRERRRSPRNCRKCSLALLPRLSAASVTAQRPRKRAAASDQTVV